MSAFIDLQPGQPIRVVRIADPRPVPYESTVREVTEDGLRVDVPAHDGGTLAVAVADVLRFYVDVHGRMYTFAAGVRAVTTDGAGGLTVAMPNRVEHTERREFYRLATMLAPRYAAILNADGEEQQRLAAAIVDISGGGMRLRSKHNVHPGAWVRLIFRLADDSEEVDITVDVLSAVEEQRGRSYQLHCRYRELSRAMQERIVRFVFSQQVELLQRGVL